MGMESITSENHPDYWDVENKRREFMSYVRNKLFGDKTALSLIIGLTIGIAGYTGYDTLTRNHPQQDAINHIPAKHNVSLVYNLKGK